jgi:hypothetical protein
MASLSSARLRPHDPRKLPQSTKKYPHNSEFLDRTINDAHDLERRLNQITFSNEEEFTHFRILGNAAVVTSCRGQTGLHRCLTDVRSSRFSAIYTYPPGERSLVLSRDMFMGLVEGLKISPSSYVSLKNEYFETQHGTLAGERN